MIAMREEIQKPTKVQTQTHVSRISFNTQVKIVVVVETEGDNVIHTYVDFVNVERKSVPN